MISVYVIVFPKWFWFEVSFKKYIWPKLGPLWSNNVFSICSYMHQETSKRNLLKFIIFYTCIILLILTYNVYLKLVSCIILNSVTFRFKRQLYIFIMQLKTKLTKLILMENPCYRLITMHIFVWRLLTIRWNVHKM